MNKVVLLNNNSLRVPYPILTYDKVINFQGYVRVYYVLHTAYENCTKDKNVYSCEVINNLNTTFIKTAFFVWVSSTSIGVEDLAFIVGILIHYLLNCYLFNLAVIFCVEVTNGLCISVINFMFLKININSLAIFKDTLLICFCDDGSFHVDYTFLQIFKVNSLFEKERESILEVNIKSYKIIFLHVKSCFFLAIII